MRVLLVFIIVLCFGLEDSWAQTVLGTKFMGNGFVNDDHVISDYSNTMCSSFKPIPGKQYIISGWTKEKHTSPQKTYAIAKIKVVFQLKPVNGVTPSAIEKIISPSGAIIDGWQRIIGDFEVPANAKDIAVTLYADSTVEAFFDDIRIHPFNGNLKSFVYDYNTLRLMSELDENNYATFYEYDKEGGLVRVKKETSRGVYTIKETRSSSTKRENQSE